MGLPLVYVETTIPSFYFELRTEPEIVARRNWTRRWWGDATLMRYDLVTSEEVLTELSEGIPERSDARLDLIRDLPLLPPEPEIAGIVLAYIREKVMPADTGGDAAHSASASFHRCDYW